MRLQLPIQLLNLYESGIKGIYEFGQILVSVKTRDGVILLFFYFLINQTENDDCFSRKLHSVNLKKIT